MTATGQNELTSRTGEQLARSIALHLMHLLAEASMYLGRTVLDLGDAIRRALLLRNRRKFPERAAAIDSATASLRDRNTMRWSSWADVPAGRQMEIRAAAVVIMIAAVFVCRAWLNSGRNHSEQAASRASAPPVSYSPSAHATEPQKIPARAVDSMLADPREFLKICKEAAPGQWVLSGDESALMAQANAQANLARANAEAEIAKASAFATQDKWARSTGRVDAATQAANTAARDLAEKTVEAKGFAVADATKALSEAQRQPHPIMPVLGRGELGAWDDFKVLSPVVIKEGNRYRMWYIGCHFLAEEYSCGVGHAQSRDGVGWEKTSRPVLPMADTELSQALQSITVVRGDSEYLMWYAFAADPLIQGSCSTLNLAISKDGLAWKPQGAVLSGNCEFTGHLWPSAFFDGKTIHLWYLEYDFSSSGALMHVTSTDGEHWQKAGATDLGTLKDIVPGRIWILSHDLAGFRALFAARPQPGYFGLLQSADGSSWKIADGAPQLAKSFSGSDRVPESPTTIQESDGTRMWFALPDRYHGSKQIALAFEKAEAP
jgi:hypothetical protein